MDRKAVESYCREYMDFLAKAKTERRAYAAAVALLTKAGFREISPASGSSSTCNSSPSLTALIPPPQAISAWGTF